MLRIFLVIVLLAQGMTPMSVKIASLYAEISADTTKLQSGLGNAKSGLLTIKDVMTGVTAAAGLLTTAYYAVGKAIDETVGVSVEYANQVRTITQVTGQNADAVSRMIQVADDYKISTDQLTLAMKKMATEGSPLTIESLAALSDEYLQLNAGVERQTFLTEKFGRQGIAFAEIMLAGSDAIRTQADAISDNLILTEAAVKQAREYELANDALNDSVTGLKTSIGVKLTPALTNAAKAGQVTISVFSEFGHLLTAFGLASSGMMDEAIASIHEFKADTADAISGINFQFGKNAEAVQNQLGTMSRLGNSFTDLSANMSDSAIVAQDYTDQFNFLTSASQSYQDSINEIASIEQKIAEARAAGYTSTAEGSVLGNLNDELDAARKKADALANQFVLDMFKMTISADGVITQAEMDAYFGMAEGMGEISAEASAAARNLWNAANAAIALALAPSDKTFNITTNYIQNGKAVVVTQSGKVQDAPVKPMAKGGDTSGWFWTGDTTGGLTPYSELVYAPGGARVYNASESRRIAAGWGAPRYVTGVANTSTNPSAVLDTDAYWVDQSAKTPPEPVDDIQQSTYEPRTGKPGASGGNVGASATKTSVAAASIAVAAGSISTASSKIVDSGKESAEATKRAAAEALKSAQQQNEILFALLQKTASKDDIMSAFTIAVQQNM